MNHAEPVQTFFNRVSRAALMVGILGMSTTFAAFGSNPAQFYRSYLFAYLFWIGLPLGCLAVLMMHHLTGGRWGLPIRRLAEAGSRTFVLMAVLFGPIPLGLSHLFLWAQPASVAADPVLQYKKPYLNPSFFMIRAGIYFLIWVSLAYFLCTWSREEDENPSPRLPARFEGLSGPGLILYGLTVTFASVDWVMSLEPHWFSTIYGMLFMVIEALTAMSFMIFFARLLAAREPALASAASPAQWNDLGNLLLAFVMLWAYLTFSQFLIIWAGNLKDEIPWYVRRISGAWGAIAVVLIIFHFMVPFLLLLSRGVKRRMEILATLAGALLLISWLDLYWLVVPAFEPGPHLHPVDLTAPLGIGGFWVATFLWQLKRRPLVPLHAVDLEEAVGHGD